MALLGPVLRGWRGVAHLLGGVREHQFPVDLLDPLVEFASSHDGFSQTTLSGVDESFDGLVEADHDPPQPSVDLPRPSRVDELAGVRPHLGGDEFPVVGVEGGDGVEGASRSAARAARCGAWTPSVRLPRIMNRTRSNNDCGPVATWNLAFWNWVPIARLVSPAGRGH